jgi:multimeric flavodoxin WrbA
VSVLILNAGLGGRAGNSEVVAARAQRELSERGAAHESLLLEGAEIETTRAALDRAERFVFVSGTYWGGFSSLLQRLFEELTATEGSSVWLGKPASVLVSAHQVGAQSVLWRLQGLLVTLGCTIPPMSGVVICKTGEALRRLAPEQCSDVWGLEDVATAMHNLLAAPARAAYRAWPVDAEHFRDRWLEPEADD